MTSINTAIDRTCSLAGLDLERPHSPSARVLATLRRLRHYARTSFVMKVANECYPFPEAVSRSQVEAALVTLAEDNVVEIGELRGTRLYRVRRSYD